MPPCAIYSLNIVTPRNFPGTMMNISTLNPKAFEVLARLVSGSIQTQMA